MKKFTLKSGDKVFVYVLADNVWEVFEVVLKGVFATIKLQNKYLFMPSCGLFYAYEYGDDFYAIVAKKKWHIPFAVICERIRLNIPTSWAKRLKLEQ